MIKKLYNNLVYFMARTSDDKIGVYSAQSAFFILMSIFPMVMLVFTLIGYTSLSQKEALTLVVDYFPSSIEPMIEQIVNEVYGVSGSTMISVTGIAAMWAASKGVFAINTGMYGVYRVKDKRNYLVARIASIFYTILFLLMIILTLVLLVFGERIKTLADKYINIPVVQENNLFATVQFVFIERFIILLTILTIFFLLLFKSVRHLRYGLGQLLPGALFSALGWLLFSRIFSAYVNQTNLTYTYGSLTAIVVSMLWLYTCIFILFLGCEINVVFKNEFLKLSRSLRYLRLLKSQKRKLKKRKKRKARQERKEFKDSKKGRNL